MRFKNFRLLQCFMRFERHTKKTNGAASHDNGVMIKTDISF